MNNIQKSIFGCVVPANSSSSDGSSAENVHCMAGFLDTLEVDITSCVEDGDALHSVFAESSMSSQGSDPSAEEATNHHAFPQERSAESSMSSQGSDPSAEEATNHHAFPQERSAESSMSSQGSDPSAEEATNHHAFPQERSAESSMSSQGSDLLAEILKILATPEYDDLANQVANIYAFSQKSSAESSMNSQGSEPSVRKKIKRNDAESSEAQQAQRKNADTACSKRVCMKIDGRKLNINGRIISLGSKESVFMKLLFEKRNIYVPTDDLYVAVYGDEAGNWNKSSLERKKTFLFSIRKSTYEASRRLPCR